MVDRGRARCRDVRQGNISNEVSRCYTGEERGVKMLDRGRTRCQDVRQGKSEVSKC